MCFKMMDSVIYLFFFVYCGQSSKALIVIYFPQPSIYLTLEGVIFRQDFVLQESATILCTFLFFN